MKKLAVILSALVLLVAGAFLLHTRDQMQRTEEKIMTLDTAVEAVAAELTELQTVFVNETALARFAEEKTGDPDDVVIYLSPEGIRFRSQSDAWDEEKLEALYQELLLNKHGKELYMLAEVIVHAEPDDYALASHQGSAKNYSLTLNFPTLPKQSIFTFYRNGGVINLYDGDERNTVEKMAGSLSHEYGHHFTFYYMLDTPDGCPYYEGTEYAKLRQLENVEQARTYYRSSYDYYDNHAWYYYEIAAEDYVVLMGSPTTRTVEDYYDVQEALYGRRDSLTWARNAH